MNGMDWFMLRLVIYDITHAKRLAKVARICKDYGIRVGYSVFECDLSERRFAGFWEKLGKVVDTEKDRLTAYRICASCMERIQSIGPVNRPEKPLIYMV